MHKACAQEVLDHVEANPTLGTRKGDEIIRWCTAIIEAPDPAPIIEAADPTPPAPTVRSPGKPLIVETVKKKFRKPAA